MALSPLKRAPRALGLSVLAAFLLLAGTAEERTFGTVTDEQQMLYTAISIAETFELGIARGQTFAISRPAGDALSPYGMGLPLLEVPFALAAGPWETRFGARTSQTLFVLLQVLLVTAAAAGAGLLAKTLGAGLFGQVLAVFGTALASPLWPYTACGFTEPLQAVCLVFAVTFAARASRPAGRSAETVRADGRHPRVPRLAARAGLQRSRPRPRPGARGARNPDDHGQAGAHASPVRVAAFSARFPLGSSRRPCARFRRA